MAASNSNQHCVGRPEDISEACTRGLNEALDSHELVRLFRTGSLDVEGVLKRIAEAQPGDAILTVKDDGSSLLNFFSILGCYEIVEKLWGRGLRPIKAKSKRCTILHSAVRTYPLDTTITKDPERAKILQLYLTCDDLSEAAPVNHINNFGWTALKMAIRLNLEKCVEVLLYHGADVHVAGGEGNYPLHDAVGNHSILKLILKADPEAVNLQNREGSTALLLALKRGDLASCQVLLEGRVDTNIPNKEGITPLVQAAKMGHSELLQALVKHGAQVNAQAGEQGLTALHWAAHKEMKQATLYLIEHGADVLAKDRVGRTPLSMATAELAEKMRAMAKCTGCHPPCTMTPEEKAVDACCRGDAQALWTLLHTGIDINHASGDTQASLAHMAAYYGQLNVVMFLFHHGACIKAVDKDGDSILHFACMKQFPESHHNQTVRMLLSAIMAEPNHQNLAGDTPLMTAIKHCFPERAKMFILHKADISLANSNDELPLHHASRDIRNLEVLFHLAELSTNLDPRDKQGLTPMMYAVRANCSPAVKYLLQRGADPNLRDNQGTTPLLMATQEKNYFVSELLLLGGADPCAATLEGKTTPLHFAIRKHMVPLVKLLWAFGADFKAKDSKGNTPFDAAPPKMREGIQFALEARTEIEQQLREGRNADSANRLQPSTKEPRQEEATPTNFERCSNDVPPCPDTESAICRKICPVTLRQTLKLAANAKNRSASNASTDGHTPCSNEATPTLSHHAPMSNELPPSLLCNEGLKNRSKGQSSEVTVEERREEDTGQLDQSNQSDQLDNQGEEGPLSLERSQALCAEVSSLKAQLCKLQRDLVAMESANQLLNTQNHSLEASMKRQEAAVVTGHIRHAMALSMHVLTHGMMYSEKSIRQDRSHDLPTEVGSGVCGSNGSSVGAGSSGGCGNDTGLGNCRSELPRRLSHESSRDSIDKSPDLSTRGSSSHHEDTPIVEEAGSCDRSCDPEECQEYIDAKGLSPKWNPLKNGCLQWWMIDKSAIKVADSVLNSAPPPATPCSSGPDCQFFEVTRGTFRHLGVVVRTIRSVPTWDYDTYMTFFQEANFLSCLHCPHIVQFLGVCFEPTSQTCSIVNEYMSRGSLYSILHEERVPLQWSTRVGMMLDVSRGMAFLHSYNVLHRNLTPRNILIGEHFNAKINDFDLYETKVKCGFQAKCPIAPVYCAPEAREDLSFTLSTDVYSFGVVLYECGTGKKFFAELQSNAVALVMRVMMGSRPGFPREIPASYRDLTGLCWKQDPHLRPAFETVAAELAKVASTAT